MTGRDFVRTSVAAAEPPPIGKVGPLAQIAANLFGTPFNLVLTLLSVSVIAITIPPLLRFLLIDAVWTGDSREACLGASGACWPFVRAKFGQFIYGFYPHDERWRPDLVFAIGAVLLAPLLVPRVPFKAINAVLFFGAYPLATLVLLTGGNFDLRAFFLGRLIDWGEIAGLGFANGLRWSFWSDFALSAFLFVAVTAGLARLNGRSMRAAAAGTAGLFLVLGAALVALDFDFDMRPVETRAWGGFLVTLVVAVCGIVASLPLGILLALGRRSEMPLVRVCATTFIEFWRGVPLITVLFFAAYMLPLFLPRGITFDVLLRALVGIAIFSAAYMAEVIRGGLQAIPRAQYEAAEALGLGYWRTMGLVVLPQALTLVIPGIVNTFIGLFKDTTLVMIIAIFDLLGQLRSAFADPNWATPVTVSTGFAFAGIIYFTFCFAMSRYAMFVERRLGAAERR
jgi:general L-amino acid transport system permease protein